jgi:hypothetical protein
MEYPEYPQRVELISELSQLIPLKESEDAFLQLILSNFSDMDKIELCVIPASLSGRGRNSEAVLPRFDKGTAGSQPSSRFKGLEKGGISVQSGSKE